MDQQPDTSQNPPSLDAEIPVANDADLSVENSNEVPDTPAIEPFSWDAQEYIHHQKKPSWFIGLFVVAAGFAVLAVVTRQWFSLVLLVTMVVAIASFANKPPRVLNYVIDEAGLTVGDKRYGYEQFKSFSVVREAGWHSIDFDPVQRFMARVTVLFDDEDLQPILDRLQQHLPRNDRNPDIIERLARSLRF